MNAHVYELNRTHAKPVTLLVEQEIKEGINLEELREILCQHVPANRIFYSFQESPCPSVVVFRRQIRQVFKEGQKWSSDFMSFKLSQYFVQLAHVYRKTDGYSLANHDHAMALDLYREGLHWWPQFQALIGAAYLVLFDEERFRNREEGMSYLAQVLEPSLALRKFNSAFTVTYYQRFAEEFQQHVWSRENKLNLK